MMPRNPDRRPNADQLRLKQLAVRAIGIGSFYAAVLIYFSATTSNFLTWSNCQIIISGATVLGIVAIGQAVVMITGEFDLSVGGVAPLGAVLFGIFQDHMHPTAAILLAVCVGAAAGLLNGSVVALFRVNPLVASLAFLSIAGGAAYVISGGQSKVFTKSSAAFWGESGPFGIEYGAWAFLALAVIAGLVLRFTVYGRTLYAVGGNSEAASLAGLRVTWTSISAFVISGACAAFAGAVTASQLVASAPTVGTDTTLDSIAACVLGGVALSGGVGSMTGAVLGVLLLGTVSDGLQLLQVASFYQQIITGGILLLAIGFARVREILGRRWLATS